MVGSGVTRSKPKSIAHSSGFPAAASLVRRTATITGMDNHSGQTNDDEKVMCRLGIFQKSGAGVYQWGSWVTLTATTGTYGTMSTSVTISSFNPNDGFLLAECLLAKVDGSNRSELSWVSANN